MESDIITSIRRTKDYEKFKFVKGNRKTNPKNYSKLYKSMKEEQLLIPICVNENYEIVDGQHRFSVCRDLELDVYYYMVEGYGLSQVKRANIVSSNWKKDDYLHMFIEDENQDYIEFNRILKKYDSSITNLLKIFSAIQGKNNAAMSFYFENGNFTVDKKEYVIEFLENLEDFSFFGQYKSTQFIGAFLKLYVKPDYIHDRMKSKLVSHKHTLTKKNTMDDYLAILCNKIYSYGVTKNPIYYSSESKKFHE